MTRMHIASDAPWESKAGYSRAVRIGNIIEVAGTVSIKGGKPFAADDPYRQTLRIFEIIEKALQSAGADMKDIIRTRMYLTDISQWEEVIRAHGEVLGEIRPAASLIGVKALLDPAYLVEIEVTAVAE